MSDPIFGLWMFVGLISLILMQMPIAFAMLSVGLASLVILNGWSAMTFTMSTAPFWQFNSYDLIVIPLFVLLGEIASKAGYSRDLFHMFNAFIGHRKGGIAIAAIGSCASFGSICGSSMATASTMAQVSLPEMRKLGYEGGFASATIAAGGTLGMLIPPSIVLVLYAILAEASIVDLFLSAVLPGILAVIGYMLAVTVIVLRRPEVAGSGERSDRGTRLRALIQVFPISVIFLVMLGGIYGGVFTPTEGASVGVVLILGMAVAQGRLRLDGAVQAIRNTASTTAMMFLILLGAKIFTSALALTQMPAILAGQIAGLDLPPIAVMTVIILIYVALGCIMDGISMLFMTVPIFLPIVLAFDIGLTPDELAIWFGIIALMVVEIGLITPPVGLNIFIIRSFAMDVPLSRTVRSLVAFLCADFAKVMLLVFFPAITLALL